MILADSNFFIALPRPHDRLNVRALKWSGTIREPIVTTEYILWECVNFLSRPIDRDKAHFIVERMKTASTCELILASPDLRDAGLRLHGARPDKAWSLTDCISFVVMKERSITRALTFDSHFEQAGFEALLQHDPPQ